MLLFSQESILLRKVLISQVIYGIIRFQTFLVFDRVFFGNHSFGDSFNVLTEHFKMFMLYDTGIRFLA